MNTTASKTINKKRKNGDEEISLSAGQEKEDGLAHELKAIKSVMKELLDHSHSQVASIQDEMKSTNDEVKGMRNNVKNIRDKCNAMEKSLQKIQNTNSSLHETDTNFRDQMDSRFDNVENKQKYHELLLKNQKWEYSAPCLDGDSNLPPRSQHFLGQIKDKTCNMRHGTRDGTVALTLGAPLPPMPIVQSSPMPTLSGTKGSNRVIDHICRVWLNDMVGITAISATATGPISSWWSGCDLL